MALKTLKVWTVPVSHEVWTSSSHSQALALFSALLSICLPQSIDVVLRQILLVVVERVPHKYHPE